MHNSRYTRGENSDALIDALCQQRSVNTKNVDVIMPNPLSFLVHVSGLPASDNDEGAVYALRSRLITAIHHWEHCNTSAICANKEKVEYLGGWRFLAWNDDVFSHRQCSNSLMVCDSASCYSYCYAAALLLGRSGICVSATVYRVPRCPHRCETSLPLQNRLSRHLQLQGF